MRSRGLTGVAALALAVAGVVVGTAGPAAAVDVNLTCDAYGLNPDGSPNFAGAPLATGVAQSLSFGALTGPTEVDENTSFTVGTASNTTSLPSQQTVTVGGNPLSITVLEIKNVTTKIQVDGAASLGATSTSGGNVLNPTVTKNGNVLTVGFDGSQGGSTTGAGLPPGNNYFPGGSNLISPAVSIGLTAGSAGSSISAKVTQQDIDLVVSLGFPLGVHLRCTADDNSLGTVQVVAPPPPGAPNAVADVATTPAGDAVTIGVLDNDEPDAQLPIDADSLSVTTEPGHGTATINQDHTITYTPDDGFSGDDTFDYQVCSLLAQNAPCDIATVTVTVQAPPTPTTLSHATTTTTKVTTQGSTSAPAKELPRTGSSGMPMTVWGALLVAVGFGVTRLARTRRSINR
jgi:hypothetical protein